MCRPSRRPAECGAGPGTTRGLREEEGLVELDLTDLVSADAAGIEVGCSESAGGRRDPGWRAGVLPDEARLAGRSTGSDAATQGPPTPLMSSPAQAYAIPVRGVRLEADRDHGPPAAFALCATARRPGHLLWDSARQTLSGRVFVLQKSRSALRPNSDRRHAKRNRGRRHVSTRAAISSTPNQRGKLDAVEHATGGLAHRRQQALAGDVMFGALRHHVRSISRNDERTDHGGTGAESIRGHDPAAAGTVRVRRRRMSQRQMWTAAKPRRRGPGRALLGAVLIGVAAAPAAAQPAEPPTRTSLIEQAQAEKGATLQPYVPGEAEKYLDYAENYLLSGRLNWHPFFQSAYSGGGFTLGAGYLKHVGAYNTLDMRGSITLLRLQADRGAVPRAGVVQTAGDAVAARRAGARRPRSASTGWERRSRWTKPDQLRLQATVRIGDARAPARRAAFLVLARRPRGVAVGTDARRPGPRRRSRRSTRPRHFPASAPSPPICIRKARWASTGARRPATRGAADSTA